MFFSGYKIATSADFFVAIISCSDYIKLIGYFALLVWVQMAVAELSAVKEELAQYKSVRGQLRTVDLEQENDRLRKRIRTYEDVISRNNLWSYFSRRNHKTISKEDSIYHENANRKPSVSKNSPSG